MWLQWNLRFHSLFCRASQNKVSVFVQNIKISIFPFSNTSLSKLYTDHSSDFFYTTFLSTIFFLHIILRANLFDQIRIQWFTATDLLFSGHSIPFPLNGINDFHGTSNYIVFNAKGNDCSAMDLLLLTHFRYFDIS